MNQRERIVEAMGAQESALRRAGVELAVDHLLGQPLSAFLDVDAVTTLLVSALARGNVERVVARHVLPGLGRVRAALARDGERVGDAVPEEARLRIDALVTKRDGPRFGWLRGALDRDKLRVLLSPALQEVFVSFAGRVPGVGRDTGAGSAVGAAAGLVGRLGRGAGERMLNLGKSVADGLGVDIEARLREAARDYSQGAVASLQRAIVTRLAAPEAAALIEGLSRSVLEQVLKTPISTILDDFDRLPLGEAIALSAPIIEHDLARELWRKIVEVEVQAVLALEGQRSVRELLEEAGLLTQVRTHLVERGDATLRPLFTSPDFAAWIDRVLAL